MHVPLRQLTDLTSQQSTCPLFFSLRMNARMCYYCRQRAELVQSHMVPPERAVHEFDHVSLFVLSPLAYPKACLFANSPIWIRPPCLRKPSYLFACTAVLLLCISEDSTHAPSCRRYTLSGPLSFLFRGVANTFAYEGLFLLV